MPSDPPPVLVPSSVVDCAVYVDGKRLPGRWTHTDAIHEVRTRGEGFVWIGLFEPDDEQIRGLANTFGLHELAVRAAMGTHPRPKLESIDQSLLMVVKTVHHVAHESPTTANEIVETGEIVALLAPDFIVTVRHGEHSGLHDLRTELEAVPERLRLGPAAVLHAITDRVVDSYLAVTEAVAADIDELESIVFAPRSPIGAEQMYLMKREVLELRRSVLPLATQLRRLADADLPAVPAPVRSYFRDVDSRLSTVAERISQFDELLTTLLNATLAKITLQQTNDMRKITAWAAIIAVPTMVFGVYGMNFEHMPELEWTFGYPLVMAVTLGACLILYRMFRRNRWL